MHIFGQKFISISLVRSQKKMKLKSGHLELRFSVYDILSIQIGLDSANA